MVAREARSTRDQETRKKTWTPPNKLDLPEPPVGMKYRWVRHELRGESEAGNVYERKRQGYEVVNASEIADYHIDKMEDGSYAGAVRSGDLILMKVPEEIAGQRNDYFEEQANRMQQSVDHEMQRSGNEKMPWKQEADHSSKVKVGSGSAPTKFED